MLMTLLHHKVFIVPLLQKVSDTDCDYDSGSVALDAHYFNRVIQVLILVETGHCWWILLENNR